MSIVIQVDNVSKAYRLGVIGGGTLRDDLHRWWAGIRKKPDPTTPVGKYEDERTENGLIWALHDINLQVRAGEVLGVIGRNGAGKSTLLKILSRVTGPTSGNVRMKGRLGSLLEVGTGFHPELTGRENIYLNGAILGMKRVEIHNKMDEIITFSEIEQYIDTPVKRYSSGMRVRLAFAVAAHLEPEILLIDEVLAVGDANFQRKCLGKIDDVSRHGRTVLFVSHNMAAIQNLCQRAILLRDGRIISDGQPFDTIEKYLVDDYAETQEKNRCSRLNMKVLKQSNTSTAIQIVNVEAYSDSNQLQTMLRTGDPLTIRIDYSAKKRFQSPAFGVTIRNFLNEKIIVLNTSPISGYAIKNLGKSGYVTLKIESLPLTSGRYFIDIMFKREKIENILKLERVIELYVEPKDVYRSGKALNYNNGIFVVPHLWHHHVDSDS